MKTPYKGITYNREWTPEGSRERYRWIENASRGLRVVGFADEIARAEGSRMINHKGWYLDPWGDCCRNGEGLVRGAVVQLPARNGEPQYVPAVADDCNADAYIADFHSVTADKMEAARAADSMAEAYAERERDYRTKDAAERAIEDARESICDARKVATRLVSDLRTAGHTLPPSVRDTVKLRVRALCAEVSDAVKRIRTLTDSPYSIIGG